MKKTLIISVLLLSTAAFTFAEGFNRPSENGRFGNSNNRQGIQREIVAEILEIAGKITLNENECPTIKSGKEDVDILIGPAVVEALDLKSGNTVSVNGIKVPGPNWSVDGKSAVKVREITVNGKTYLVMGGMRMNGDMDGRGMNSDKRSGSQGPGKNR